MTLAEYMKAESLTDEKFAPLVGLSRSTVTRLRNGSHIPSSGTIAEIARVTGGKVAANDWFGLAA